MIKDKMEDREIILKIWAQGLIEKWLLKNET